MVTTPTTNREQALRNGELVSAYRVDQVIGSGGMGWV